jgi:hypothetical protein
LRKLTKSMEMNLSSLVPVVKINQKTSVISTNFRIKYQILLVWAQTCNFFNASSNHR